MLWADPKLYETKVNIFAGDMAAVSSDVQEDLGGFPIKVDDIKSYFHSAQRKHGDTWINTGLYHQGQKAIAMKGNYMDYN